jgi:antitoxin MazE
MVNQTTLTFEGTVQPWGNSLGLRITRAISELAHLEKGARVSIEITDEGVLIRRKTVEPKRALPWTEADLLKGLTPHTAHADELPKLTPGEYGI